MAEGDDRSADFLGQSAEARLDECVDLHAVDLAAGEHVGDRVDDDHIGPERLRVGYQLLPYRLALERAGLPVPQDEEIVLVLARGDAQRVPYLRERDAE